MANVTLSRGTTLPDSSSKTDFHNLVDTATATVSNIVNADIDAAASIADTKLATISTAGKVATSALPINPYTSKEVVFLIDGAGSAIETGIKGDIRVPFTGTITGAYLLADQSGSIVIDLWKDTQANFPPLVGDSICASAKPTISSATNSSDTTLTGWTVAVTSGDIIRVNVDSCTTIQRVSLALTFTRTA